MEEILSRVLKKVIPTEKERRSIETAVKKIEDAVEKTIKPLGLSYTFAGSFLRDTWLPNKKEFDVFILFPENYPREKLESEGLKIGKKIMKILDGTYKIAYAEHPYVRGTFGEYSVDIVPCYAVKSATQIKSAVDRTPFHNRWLLKNFSPEMSDEVRLFKQFCKANGIYGSDAKTEGLSGYLCELLIVKYKTFQNLIKAVSKWEPGRVFIDLEGYHKELSLIHI